MSIKGTSIAPLNYSGLYLKQESLGPYRAGHSRVSKRYVPIEAQTRNKASCSWKPQNFPKVFRRRSDRSNLWRASRDSGRSPSPLR